MTVLTEVESYTAGIPFVVRSLLPLGGMRGEKLPTYLAAGLVLGAAGYGWMLYESSRTLQWGIALIQSLSPAPAAGVREAALAPSPVRRSGMADSRRSFAPRPPAPRIPPRPSAQPAAPGPAMAAKLASLPPAGSLNLGGDARDGARPTPRTVLSDGSRNGEAHEQSRRAYERILERSPENLPARYGFALDWFRDGYVGEAREVLIEILRDDPDHRAARKFLREIEGMDDLRPPLADETLVHDEQGFKRHQAWLRNLDIPEVPPLPGNFPDVGTAPNVEIPQEPRLSPVLEGRSEREAALMGDQESASRLRVRRLPDPEAQ